MMFRPQACLNARVVDMEEFCTDPHTVAGKSPTSYKIQEVYSSNVKLTLGIYFGVKVAIHFLTHHKTVKHNQAPSNIRQTQTHTRTHISTHAPSPPHTHPLTHTHKTFPQTFIQCASRQSIKNHIVLRAGMYICINKVE